MVNQWLIAVRDRLITPDSCYQAGPDGDYLAASHFCQSKLRGTLATEAGLGTQNSPLSLLSELPPHLPGQTLQWWLQADNAATCKTVSSDGSVSQQDCGAAPPGQTVRRPLCHLGKHQHFSSPLSTLIGPDLSRYCALCHNNTPQGK